MRNYIFDWSGTMYDTLPTFLKICEIIFKEHGKEPPTKEYVKETFEMPWMKWWSKQIPDLNMQEHHEAYKRAIKQAPKGTEIPGMWDVIHELHRQGKTLFIISSDPKERLYEELGTRKELFKEVLSAIFYKSEAIEDLLEGYHLDPKDTVYIGDVGGDAEEAHKAGVNAWLVTWGFSKKEVLETFKAERLIEKPEELLEKT